MSTKIKNPAFEIPSGIDADDYAIVLDQAPTYLRITDPDWVEIVRNHLSTLDLDLDQRAEIEADDERMWALRLHIEAIHRAADTAAARSASAAAEALRLAETQCPVCLASDRDHIGDILPRPLLPGQYLTDAVPSLRSCLACWHVAASAHIEKLAEEEGNGGRSRRASITAALQAVAN